MKKIAILVVCSLAVTMLFSGCGKPVNLSTALKNSESIKTCSYDINMRAAVKNTGEENVSLSLQAEGSYEKTADRTKTSADVTVLYEGETIKLPVYIDSANDKLDFELFVGVPDVLKEYLSEGVENLYISSSGLDEMLKQNLPEEEYNAYKESLEKAQTNPEEKALVNALTTCVQSYTSKNIERMQKFEPIEKKSASENGVYTITINKADIKAIVNDFLSNDENYQILKSVYASSLSTVTDDQELPDAETMTSEFNKAVDEISEAKLTITFTIENELVTNTNVVLFVSKSADEQLTLEFDMQLSNININQYLHSPDKDADSTRNIVDLINELMGQMSYADVDPSYLVDAPTME